MLSESDLARFSKPTESVKFDGILSDMDGTIIDSTDAIVKYWKLVAEDVGADYREIIKSSHGRRGVDTLKLYDPSKANFEYVSHMEGRCPREFGKDASEIPGARALLSSLDAADVPWAIVTSGTIPLVTGWLDVMKLARPKRMVTAEDVQIGKPDPECYLEGKQRLSSMTSIHGDFIVLEDAPAGIQAGKQANCKVIGLATSHTIDQVLNAGADWIVKDLESIRYERSSTGHVLHISNALEVGSGD